jgi:hypothetical protein
MINASAWKYTTDFDGPIYRIQVNLEEKTANHTRDMVEKALEDWRDSGEGWNNSEQILFFSKKFSDAEKWEEWVNKFKDFNLKVLDRDGKSKKVIKVEAPTIAASISTRVCSKCNQPGHNARSCVNAFRKQTETIVVKQAVEVQQTPDTKSRKCSKCGGYAHDARRCISKQPTLKQNTKATVSAVENTGRTCGKCGQKGHNARTCSKK